MTSVIQTASSDAYVTHVNPSTNTGGSTTLTVCNDSGSAGRFVYVYFNRPFALGVTVSSAILRVYQRGAATGGARTLTVRRIASSAWKESTINWTNKPAVTGATATSASQGNGGTDGRVWELDVTSHMQQIADGSNWYGFRIESSNATPMRLFSSESATFQPQLEVEWSDAPETPSFLAPSNGRAVSVARPTLRFDFSDTSGDLTMQAYQVQMNATDVWSSPSVDTGTVAADLPEHTVGFDVSLAATWFWRARVQDGAGLWSGWSDSVSFTRTAKPTVTIDNPSGFVSEGTPPILWTVTGGTQTAYQVFLTDPADTSEVLWTSGKVTSTDDSVTIPARTPPLLSPGGEYGLTVRIWDSVVRESTPADPIYTDESTTFTFDLTTDVDPVSAFTVDTSAGSPSATAQFTDATAADSYTFLVDGVAIAVGIDPSDIFVSGTTYEYALHGVTPQVAHTAEVLRVVNGETSDDNPTDTFTIEPKGLWLSTADGAYSVCIAGEDPLRLSASELVAVRRPIGAGANPVIIRQAQYGRDGAADGVLVAVPGQTLAQAAEAWEAITSRELVGGVMHIVDLDTSMRALIYNTVRGVETEFPKTIPVSFSVIELL